MSGAPCKEAEGIINVALRPVMLPANVRNQLRDVLANHLQSNTIS